MSETAPSPAPTPPPEDPAAPPAGRPLLPPLQRAATYGDRPAVVDRAGTVSYRELLAAAQQVARRLLLAVGLPDLAEERVAFLLPPGAGWVAALWGIQQAGGIAVPLSHHHTGAELALTLNDVEPRLMLADAGSLDRLAALAEERGRPVLELPADVGSMEPVARVRLPVVDPTRRGLILFTSGSTGRPKGVVWSHRALAVQMATLVAAWGWQKDDRTLLLLPLHHFHGILNVVGCALWSGACCEMPYPPPDAVGVWQRLAGGVDGEDERISVLMAVPTIYHRMVERWRVARADDELRQQAERWRGGAAALRLAVSGSAALPKPLFDNWHRLAGEPLLERYGMTEVGMVLSNPLLGDRSAGQVGRPLPGVEARLVDEAGKPVAEGESGEIEVRGRGIFREYWRQPEATAAAFRPEGWFRTGDQAAVEEDDDGRSWWRILGRGSVDIIKSGGYKLSALEIEAALLAEEEIAACAVVGLPDQEWGERVAAAVVAADGREPPALDELRRRLADRLAPYKLPSRLAVVDELPTNALGKVVKRRLVSLFEIA